MMEAKMKKLLFIINPKAGVKKKKDRIKDVVKIFEEYGYGVGVKLTKKRADGTRIAKKYGDQADMIVCMGGDGTLNEVMEGIIEAGIKVPLGYIPAGSTNDFASSLGLESDPKKAAKFIMENSPKELDLGCFNGRFFVYTAAAGIFSKTSYSTPQHMKNKLGHLAYVLAGVKELFHIRKMRLRIETDSQVYEGKYIFMAINNATKVGGVMKLSEDLVEFNDGIFELMLVEYPSNGRELLKLAGKVLRQKFDGKITLTQITKARITGCEDVDWSLDGEKENAHKVIEFKVMNDAIRFIY